jgi:hypothetical protein
MFDSVVQAGRRSSRGAAVANDVLVARHGDGSVVLHVPSGTYLKLDATATQILELLQSEGEEGAAAALSTRYGLDPAVAAADVATVLREIRSARSVAAPGRRPKLTGVATVARQWASLRAPARRASFEMGLLVIGIEIALRVAPIDAIARRVGAPLATVDQADGALPDELDLSLLDDRDVLRIASADWVLGRWVYDATCLRRALAYGWILRRRRPELHIGLMAEDDILAHAWLIVDGCSMGALGGVGDFGPLGEAVPL